MKKTAAFVFAVLLTAAGCFDRRPVLHVYTWADYIAPEVAEAFETAYGCRIVIDTFDSNEMLFAKLKSGSVGYDIIVPSSYALPMFEHEGLLQKLDRTQIKTALANTDTNFICRSEYAIHYTTSITGLSVRKTPETENLTPSWRMLTNDVFKGRVTLLNDVRETMGLALKTLGYSLNTVNPKEITEAEALLINWRKHIGKFENEQYKSGLASGEFNLVHGYSGDLWQVQEEHPSCVFIYPKEGYARTFDELCILKTAPNPELAHQFIDFLFRPEQAAKNIQYIGYVMPCSAAYPLLPKELRNNPVFFPPPEIMALGENIEYLGENLRLYTEAWDHVKSAN